MASQDFARGPWSEHSKSLADMIAERVKRIETEQGDERRKFIDMELYTKRSDAGAPPLDPVRTMLKTKLTPLFPMVGEGYEFTLDTWRAALAGGPDELKRLGDDAYAHRNEAIRRLAVCRLDGRPDEAEGWAGIAAFLTKTCRLKPLEA